jgi:predicted DNA-binding protein
MSCHPPGVAAFFYRTLPEISRREAALKPRFGAVFGRGDVLRKGRYRRKIAYVSKRRRAVDKIFSARLDESVLQKMDRVTSRLGLTKKKFLEEAILGRVEEIQQAYGTDVWDETCGAWKRKEAPDQIRKTIRKEFEKSMRRHH